MSDSESICIRLPEETDRRLRDRIDPKSARPEERTLTAFVRNLIERELAANPTPKELAERIEADARQLSLLLG